MPLSNQERADRCQEAINAYTNRVDFLADAMHWCHINERAFQDILETALMHFEAETAGDDILDDLNRDVTNERNRP